MDFPLDSRQLRAFVVLANSGSFTRAAKELHLTQSAISHSMKALESDLGCALLHRVGKKVLLTQYGEHFLIRAKSVLHEMSAARLEIKQLGKWGQGRIRVGATPTACQYVLPTVFREFREGFPDCQLEIVPGDTPLVLELLRQNRVDLALTLEPVDQDGLTFRHLYTDELLFAVSPLHPWADMRRVPLNEIEEQNFILYTRTSLTFRIIEDYFQKQGKTIRSIIELGSMEAIKELVKIGMGVGILAPWIFSNEIERGSIVALPMPKILTRNWGVSAWRSRRINLQEETFIGLCEAVMNNLAKAS